MRIALQNTTGSGRHVYSAWISLLLMPIVFIIGFALAHVAYLIWPQYQEGAGLEPWWFMLVALALSYLPIAPVLVIGIRSARAAIGEGFASAWIPLALFALFLLWQVVIITAGFAGLA